MTAHKIFIRSRKEDSAFIYHVLEAHEGWTAYTTLPFQKHDLHRDLVLFVPNDWISEVNDLLHSLKEKIVILPNDPSIS